MFRLVEIDVRLLAWAREEEISHYFVHSLSDVVGFGPVAIQKQRSANRPVVSHVEVDPYCFFENARHPTLGFLPSGMPCSSR